MTTKTRATKNGREVDILSDEKLTPNAISAKDELSPPVEPEPAILKSSVNGSRQPACLRPRPGTWSAPTRIANAERAVAKAERALTFAKEDLDLHEAGDVQAIAAGTPRVALDAWINVVSAAERELSLCNRGLELAHRTDLDLRGKAPTDEALRNLDSRISTAVNDLCEVIDSFAPAMQALEAALASARPMLGRHHSVANFETMLSALRPSFELFPQIREQRVWDSWRQ